MVELQGLLSFKEYYVYDDADEMVIIKHGDKSVEALAEYEKCLQILRSPDTNATVEEKLLHAIFSEDKDEFLSGTLKWEFDIALDCIRCMSADNINTYRRCLQTSKNNIEYVERIKSKYFDISKKHELSDPLDNSCYVLKMIFSILNPYYDYRNVRMTMLFEHNIFSELYTKYSERCPEIISHFIGNFVSSKDVGILNDTVENLRDCIKSKLGPDDFFIAFLAAVEQLENDPQYKGNDHLYWKNQFPMHEAVAYSLEAKQVILLYENQFFDKVKYGKIRGEDACKKYIDENFGFRDKNSILLARCTWAAYNPVRLGKWSELPILIFDDVILEIVLMALSRSKIKVETVGDLCLHTFEEIASIKGCSRDWARMLQIELKKMGLDYKVATVATYDMQEQFNRSVTTNKEYSPENNILDPFVTMYHSFRGAYDSEDTLEFIFGMSKTMYKEEIHALWKCGVHKSIDKANTLLQMDLDIYLKDYLLDNKYDPIQIYKAIIIWAQAIQVYIEPECYLAAGMPQYLGKGAIVPCPVCGKKYMKKRLNEKYCSAHCSNSSKKMHK